MKTPVIYYGGKTSMLPVILPMIPEHKVYTEVFFGGGAVFFGKRKSKVEIVNDQLEIVVNFYQVLRTHFTELNKLIQQTIYAKVLFEKALLIMRNRSLFTPVERAWAFWMTTNFAHGQNISHGSMRNSNGENGSPPITMQRKKALFTEKLHKRIEHLIIENKDALTLLKTYNNADAFHYLDPPYPGAMQGHYAGYTMDNLQELLEWCVTCKGKFILSNYHSELMDQYTKKNKWFTSSHTFANKGLRKHDRTKNEILVWNYQLPNKTLF